MVIGLRRGAALCPKSKLTIVTTMEAKFLPLLRSEGPAPKWPSPFGELEALRPRNICPKAWESIVEWAAKIVEFYERA